MTTFVPQTGSKSVADASFSASISFVSDRILHLTCLTCSYPVINAYFSVGMVPQRDKKLPEPEKPAFCKICESRFIKAIEVYLSN